MTPWHIRDAGIYSPGGGYTKYTSNAGMAELRREIASYLDRRFGLKYDYASQILVSRGQRGAGSLLRVLLNPGTRSSSPVPSFVCYGPLTEMAGGVPVYVELKAENQFRLTPEQLKAAITPQDQGAGAALPSNPTGGIMERQDLEALAQVLRDTEIMVVSDEIYAELTYGQHHVSIANLPDMYERTIVVNGFSKSHAMTGWRMGYVCAPKPIIQCLTKLHQFGIMSAPHRQPVCRHRGHAQRGPGHRAHAGGVRQPPPLSGGESQPHRPDLLRAQGRFLRLPGYPFHRPDLQRVL